ncbi:EexN family lipoprotein [Bartonella krasnovii]|uniref:EexN family lipoprotein n=1 Tax=Bartonella krasnovii TaxID=2267275 RepID=A0ABY3W172_9HYPH|nr:EexN family lipoprotein [Bartonella krasnovii]UNF28898.1 EexN family lipoprotein [Bartonella krasnovii]UNF36892.1 EexN family lipoprotein [Bartonella krasnovii]UNF43624.1 EexN family lipoprotein [Bartonella krasnovii]
MNKVLITTLLLGTGIIAAGCEKTYSVAEFKKDKNLRFEWDARCGFAGTSKNCENMRLAFLELEKERQAKEAERSRKISEENRKRYEKFEAEQKARLQKMEAETQKILEKQRAETRAEEERRAKERAAKEQQNNH